MIVLGLHGSLCSNSSSAPADIATQEEIGKMLEDVERWHIDELCGRGGVLIFWDQLEDAYVEPDPEAVVHEMSQLLQLTPSY